MSSDCSDDEGSPGGGGGHMPVVYPWMKKIHVAGAGKQFKFFSPVYMIYFVSLSSLHINYSPFFVTYIKSN